MDGAAIVSTTSGCAGLGLAGGLTAAIGDIAADFNHSVARPIAGPAAGARMAAVARP